METSTAYSTSGLQFTVTYIEPAGKYTLVSVILFILYSSALS